jgi:hypothetical protein
MGESAKKALTQQNKGISKHLEIDIKSCLFSLVARSQAAV